MKKLIIVIMISCLGFSAFANAQAELVDEKPSTLEQKFSYAYGYLLLSSMTENFPDLDLDYMLSGADAFLEDNPNSTLDEMYGWVNEYQQKNEEEQAAADSATAVQNLKDAESFLAQNKNSSGVVTTDSGLQYKILTKGDGKYATSDDTVECKYTLMLGDGTEIDSSEIHGGNATFALTNLIPGFSEGMTLIPVGSHATFWIHPDLGYGADKQTNIPGNSLLIFDVELIDIK